MIDAGSGKYLHFSNRQATGLLLQLVCMDFESVYSVDMKNLQHEINTPKMTELLLAIVPFMFA